MKPCLKRALHQFDNVVPSTCQDSPYPHMEPKYRTKEQFAKYGPRRQPAIYVIVATGNIHEDVKQARAAAIELGSKIRSAVTANAP